MKRKELRKVAELIYAFAPDAAYSVKDIMARLEYCNAEYRAYKRGAVCIKAGSPATAIVFLLSGVMRQLLPNEFGEPMVMRVIRPGEFAALSLVYNPGVAVHPVSFVAHTDVELLELDVERIRAWRQDPLSLPFFNHIGRELCRCMYESWSKAMVLGGKDAAERVLRYLTIHIERKKTRTVAVPIAREDFAAHLGVSVAALNRALKKLQDQGRIDCVDNVITVR